MYTILGPCGNFKAVWDGGGAETNFLCIIFIFQLIILD